MKELLTFIAKSLVEHPEDVSVALVQRTDDSILLQLRVAPDDMGKVIGKQGKIAKAIRTLIKAMATIEKKKITVDIVDE